MEDGLNLLVKWYEASEQASAPARAESEQARDYYDGRQLSEAEKRVLKQRKQPEVVKNRIKRKIDYLRGLERQGRTDPKAYPRTPQDEQDADVCTDALRYVKADQNLDVKRSSVFENMLVEGFGGVECGAAKNARGAIDPKLTYLPWDRIFYDPNSAAHDFSDARYMGFITWMDAEDAKARPEWAGKEKVIDDTMARPMSSGTGSETYDDKPRWKSWADPTRKRIRVVTMYYKRDGQWMRCEFTLAGHLTDPAPSPYLDENGQPENAMILQSAYVDRDNDRYGVVRDMISTQDEVNKRGSKALHLLNSRQARIAAGALNKEEIRRELARPDGVVIADTGDFEVLGNGNEVAGHLNLMRDALAELDATGPTATMQGRSQSADQSGRAILALQQGGMVEMTPLLDNLRHFSIRLYRAAWNRIRQFWTEERWLRLTDDENNVRFAGINVTKADLAAQKIKAALKAGEIDAATAQQYALQVKADPSMQGRANVVAELDVDIDIDEQNETPTLQYEQFQTLAQLAQSGVPIPPPVLIQASTLRDKPKLLKMLEASAQQPQQPNPQQQLQQAIGVANVKKTEAEGELASARAESENLRSQLAAATLQQQRQEQFYAQPPAYAAG